MRTYGIIIGCSKSGTSSLYRYLAQHPDMASCREKEPNFFASDNWERGFDWYRDLWAQEGAVCLEASTLYTWHPLMPNAAERIKSVEEKGDFRFIYIMRDPIQRAESQIRYRAVRGYNSGEDPLENPWLMEVSRYSKQLDEYQQRFGRNRIHLITLEALNDDPKTVLREACDFLGVRSDFGFDVGTKHNQTKEKVVPARYWNFLRGLDLLRRIVRTMPRKYRGKIRNWVNPKAKYAGDRYRLTNEQRRRFIDELSADLCRLEQFYDVDTSPWNLSP